MTLFEIVYDGKPGEIPEKNHDQNPNLGAKRIPRLDSRLL